MGYTNSQQTKGFTDEQWTAITTDVHKMFKALPKKTPAKGTPGDGGRIIQIDDQKGGAPIANEEKIFFNGCGFEDADHETFVLTKKAQSYEFCKTARKPYDLAVQCTLLIAKHHAPDRITIASDGDPEEWMASTTVLMKIGVPLFSEENCARLVTGKGLLKEIAVLVLKEANSGN